MSEPNRPNLCTVNCEHIAACANKCPKCVSYGYDGLMAIGTGQSIVICQDELKIEKKKFKRSVKSLNSNEGRINCVSWIRNMDELTRSYGNFLISGSANGTLTVWGCKKKKSEYSYEFDLMCSLKNHQGGITCLDAIMYEDTLTLNQKRNYMIASSGIDSSVKIWCNTGPCIKSLTILQCINLNPSLCLTISLHTLNYAPILACGLDNSKVNLYTMKKSENEGCFSFALSLIGHEDWIRGSDFVSLKSGDVLLATCSQDGFIRLWKICAKEIETNMTDLDTLNVKQMTFETTSSQSRTYVVTLDAVLSGHEGWVYSVHWSSSTYANNFPYLLSSSMDKSVVLWKMDDESQIWIEDARFGEVGGNTLGFYGAYFDNSGSEIVGHSYNGALHLWEKSDGNIWNPGIIISGHFGAVQDISWEPLHGRYLISTSSDQTTRLFAKWYGDKKCSWHEIARPQVHGYDLQSIAMIDSFRFISGADEKVLRIFEAPEIFLQNFKAIANVTLDRATPGPEGAAVPALGLSNKAVFSSDNSSQKETPTTRGEQYIENQFRKCLLTEPPTEEYLLQNSLWPETHKLYWHVFEIFCVAANSTGTLVATTAKSSSPEHSTVVLWDTTSWKEVGQLQGHTLTVTQIEFSPDGQFLLSVSRDRTWVLHKISGDVDSGFSTLLYAKSDKKTCHGRIIWSASWTHDSKYFCTGSRDKKVMFWKVGSASINISPTVPVERVLVNAFDVPVTAVAFCKSYINESNYLLAIGKENGLIELDVFIDSPDFKCFTLWIFDVHEAHASCIKRMKWKPVNSGEVDEYHLATCGTDNMLKIFSVCCKNTNM